MFVFSVGQSSSATRGKTDAVILPFLFFSICKMVALWKAEGGCCVPLCVGGIPLARHLWFLCPFLLKSCSTLAWPCLWARLWKILLFLLACTLFLDNSTRYKKMVPWRRHSRLPFCRSDIWIPLIDLRLTCLWLSQFTSGSSSPHLSRFHWPLFVFWWISFLNLLQDVFLPPEMNWRQFVRWTKLVIFLFLSTRCSNNLITRFSRQMLDQ